MRHGWEEMQEILSVLVTVAGGLGIFLLGMKHLSEGLQAVGGSGLRKFMALATTHRMAGVGTGIVTTLIVQSSAIITAMLVGFVSSGMMTLEQAINVIIGANIGTTGTVWIVAFAPSPEVLGLTGLALGGMFYFFSRKEITHNFGLAILGLGLVLLGLFFMAKGVLPIKEMEAVREAFESAKVETFFDVAMVAAVAAVLSAAIHSAATIAIAMTLAAQGLIAYETAISVLFGANIGTTVTAWLAAIGGNRNAKRTALAHTLSNVVGSIVFLPFVLPVIIPAGKAIFAAALAPDANGLYSGIMLPIACTDTVFSVLRGVLTFPFVKPFAKLLNRLISSEGEEKPHLSALNMRAKLSPVIACEQAMREVDFMAESDLDLLKHVRLVLAGDAEDRDEEHIFHREDILDNIQREVTEFIGKIMGVRLPLDVADRARVILRLTDEFESVSDEAPVILKVIRRLRADGQKMSDVSGAVILSVHDRVMAFAKKVTAAFKGPRGMLTVEAAQAESRELHQFIRAIRQGQLGRIGPDDPTSPMRVLVELDILNAYERIRAYYLNIAETLAGGKR